MTEAGAGAGAGGFYIASRFSIPHRFCVFVALFRGGGVMDRWMDGLVTGRIFFFFSVDRIVGCCVG